MIKPIYDPLLSGGRMNIVCFVSGSGTNYDRIVMQNPNHNYLVFTNRPGCGGTVLAAKNGHPVIALSHISYLKEARKKYGAGRVPRNCPERTLYEQDLAALIEKKLGRQPDLICLAGYDQWTSDWLVDRYYPRMLNVHPGDSTKGYDGLNWIPTAKAILAGDPAIRSTLFVTDKGEDTGPVLLQSRPLDIAATMSEAGASGDLETVMVFSRTNAVNDYPSFQQQAPAHVGDAMKRICEFLQDRLKVNGDWEIYPLAVKLIAQGKVSIEGRQLYLEGKALPSYGFRLG